MALTVTLDTDTRDVLEKMATSGIQHPVAQSSVFICGPITVTVSMGGDGATPTAHLAPSETHLWPYAVEATASFDDRTLRLP